MIEIFGQKRIFEKMIEQMNEDNEEWENALLKCNFTNKSEKMRYKYKCTKLCYIYNCKRYNASEFMFPKKNISEKDKSIVEF